MPILSRVKTDPAPFGSAHRAEANQTVNRLPFPCGQHPGIDSRCSRSSFPRVSVRPTSECREEALHGYCKTRLPKSRLAGTSGIFAACGCQTVKTPEDKIANSNIPNEFKKVSMPDYVVEPPDLIVVEVLEALPGRPISGERLVRPDGKISLSFYGDVYVAGLTLPEVKEKIVLHLRKYLQDEALGLIKIDEVTRRRSSIPRRMSPLGSNRETATWSSST